MCKFYSAQYYMYLVNSVDSIGCVVLLLRTVACKKNERSVRQRTDKPGLSVLGHALEEDYRAQHVVHKYCGAFSEYSVCV